KSGRFEKGSARHSGGPSCHAMPSDAAIGRVRNNQPFELSARRQDNAIVAPNDWTACPHAANPNPLLSALVLHRFVREPLELDRKRMRKRCLTLHHDQARGILLRRNPP